MYLLEFEKLMILNCLLYLILSVRGGSKRRVIEVLGLFLGVFGGS